MGGSGVDIAVDLLLPDEQQGPDREERNERERRQGQRGGNYLCIRNVSIVI